MAFSLGTTLVWENLPQLHTIALQSLNNGVAAAPTGFLFEVWRKFSIVLALAMSFYAMFSKTAAQLVTRVIVTLGIMFSAAHELIAGRYENIEAPPALLLNDLALVCVVLAIIPAGLLPLLGTTYKKLFCWTAVIIGLIGTGVALKFAAG